MKTDAIDRDIYREEILEHYRHPMNFGALKNPSLEAGAVNPLCGDSISLQLRVDSKGTVQDVRFNGSGCALSIASASLFTEWLKGRTFRQLQKVRPSQLQKLIKAPISPARLYCALLPYTALRKIFDV